MKLLCRFASLALIVASCIALVGQAWATDSTAPSSAAATQPTLPDAISHLGAPKLNFVPAAPDVPAKSYVLMAEKSGQTLAAKDADKRMQPASLTKLMTLYIIEHRLATGKLHLDDKVLVSTRAWKTEGSRMFINPGSRVPVKLLIQGMIVSSGNDATVAMAEHIAGSEAAFATLMNQYAKALGMNHTHFVNPTGLPAPEHYTTAHDLAVLAVHIIEDFPQYYHWYSQKTFTYNKITQNNRNHLLWHNDEVDGLKTGHTEAAEYCLVASAKHKGSRFIAVVMYTDSDKTREQAGAALLNFGIQYYETVIAATANQPLRYIRTLGGDQSTTPLTVSHNVYVTVPIDHSKLILTPKLPKAVHAPLEQNQPVGNLAIALNGKTLKTVPLVAQHSNEVGSKLWFYIDLFIFWLQGLFG